MKTESSSAKKNILKKIKKAQELPVPLPFEHRASSEIFKKSIQDLEIEFAENFTNVAGKFSFCFNLEELATQLQTLFSSRNWNKIFIRESTLQTSLQSAGLKIDYTNDLANCDAAITTCEFLVARTGSIILSSAEESGRTVSVYAPVHICIAYSNQLAYNINDALAIIQKKYQQNIPSLITFATGPSRTADIEKTLVTGVHGPKEVFCFLVQA